MTPDLVILSNANDDPLAQLWLHGLRCDIDTGLVPSWIGAMIVSILADGNAKIVCIERQRWIAMKLAERIGLN